MTLHNFRNHFTTIVALLFCVLSSSASQGANLPKPALFQVTDYRGRTVTLDAPAKRIIALAPHIVENLYSAGAGDSIVGAVDYCDYPASANNIPRIGGIHSFNLESILQLKPDLVIVWGSGKGEKILNKITALGLTAYVSDPRTLDDVPRSIRDYGTLTGNDKTAEKTARSFEAVHLSLVKTYHHLPTVSALYQVWNNPLQTLNGEHIISDVINMCGGSNIFHEAESLAPKISIESVISLNPQAIIASGMDTSRPEWLDDWSKWPTISAVKNNHLFFIPPDLIQRHTVRLLEGATLMCEHLQQVRNDLTTP